MNKYDYSKQDIVKALLNVGVKQGDSILVHSNIGFFGVAKNAEKKEDYYKLFKEAIFEVIGEAGTLVVPTFTYSFLKKEVFDYNKTPSLCGFFSEMVREDIESLRSEDANFSVAAIGGKAEFFTSNLSVYSFGKDSFWDRFFKKKGKICNFNFDAASTFIHYVERELGVSYRRDIPICGKVILNGETEERVFYHFSRDVNKLGDIPDYSKFAKKAQDSNFVKLANLGRGQINLIEVENAFGLTKREIVKNANFLIKGY